jgi:hypothetical protein
MMLRTRQISMFERMQRHEDGRMGGSMRFDERIRLSDETCPRDGAVLPPHRTRPS